MIWVITASVFVTLLLFLLVLAAGWQVLIVLAFSALCVAGIYSIVRALEHLAKK